MSELMDQIYVIWVRNSCHWVKFQDDEVLKVVKINKSLYFL